MKRRKEKKSFGKGRIRRERERERLAGGTKRKERERKVLLVVFFSTECFGFSGSFVRLFIVIVIVAVLAWSAAAAFYYLCGSHRIVL